jgi:two-component system sensor histidine kinase PilS (NtrC family)
MSPITAEAPRDGQRRRLTYLMLFRVGLVTLLLAAALVAELGASVGEAHAPEVKSLWGLIVATYGLTIFFAIALPRMHRVAAFAEAQVGADLVLATLLVHVSGGAESGFVFMYILVIVGGAFVLGRGALITTVAAVALYVADGLVNNNLPLRTLIRTLAVNSVAFAATGMLATRLSTELRRAGEHIAYQGMRLRDLAALHQDVVRGLTSGLVTVGLDLHIITFNKSAAEITGIAPAHAIGRRADEVMPGLGALFAAAGDGALRRGEIVQQVGNEDGLAEARTLGVSLSPLVDAGGHVLGRIVNFQDLTELRRMQVAVERAERLAAVGRLAAGVAHEIRNPLAAISGSIELLSQGPSADAAPENTQLMGIVLREVDRLNALITELLEFARPHGAELHRLDVTATLSELLRVFENDKRLNGVQVQLRAPAPVWVDADPGQFRQVVWNLLRNAAEATSDGSPIVVEVGASQTRDGTRWARLTVRDHGPGIPPEHRGRLFEPFFSTKKSGSGLGLAIVHRIIDEHHGAIEVDNPPGGGAAITVRLPLSTQPEAESH